MEKIEFAVSGSFEQLSEFKQKAEELGWKYMDIEFNFNEEENETNPYLYFCDETYWVDSNAIVLNGFVLSGVDSDTIVFNLNTQQEQALIAIKHSLKKVEQNEMSEFLDFIVDNYTVDSNGTIMSDSESKSDRIESKEEVINAFKTMYGRTRV